MGGMFDGVIADVTKSLKGVLSDSLGGVETRAHQFITDEEQSVVRALRAGLIGTTGYALLGHRFAPQLGVTLVFAAPLAYLLTAKALAGREMFVLAAGGLSHAY